MKTVVEMAREAGLVGGPVYAQGIERFAELVRADEREVCLDAMLKSTGKAVDTAMAIEREVCAKVAEEHMRECEGTSFGVGAAIRARGNT